MFTREFHPQAFLRQLIGSEPFFNYCRERGIPFAEFGGSPTDNLMRWADTLRALPRELQARVELDFAQVNELAGRDGVAHLLDAAQAGVLPPGDVPAGPPLTLWFLLHRPEIFHAVFLHHEVGEVRAWRAARTVAHLAVADLTAKAPALAGGLRAFFRVETGAGRFCAAEARTLPDVVCFAAHVADRIRLVEGFTECGDLSLERMRPALSVLFAYYPADGCVLLKSHLRAADRINALLRCFGETVLDSPVEAVAPFDLDRLKHPFRPLPDAPDMEAIRVKTLHLRYPASLAGRMVKLETRAADAPGAIEDLLRKHVGTDESFETLRVCHAELEVRLRLDGRSKNYSIRLWPDRCSLNQTVLGDRFRRCLARWRLLHA